MPQRHTSNDQHTATAVDTGHLRHADQPRTAHGPETARTTRRSRAADKPSASRAAPAVLGVATAIAAFGVASVHVIDQEGFPGSKDPSYVGLGFYLLEVAAVVVAGVLLTRRGRNHLMTWAVAFGVAVGPLVGYGLSRGPGMPDYTDDQGNWAEPLGLVSLAVEALLLVLAVAGGALARRRTGERLTR